MVAKAETVIRSLQAFSRHFRNAGTTREQQQHPPEEESATSLWREKVARTAVADHATRIVN